MARLLTFTCITALLLLSSCKEIKQIMSPASPHEKYEQRLSKAGLKNTSMVRQWRQVASIALSDSLRIDLPYKEVGYFFSDKIEAVGFSFTARRGDKLQIRLSVSSEDSFHVFANLFEVEDGGAIDEVGYLKLGESLLEYKVGKQTRFLLRLQPELLKGGGYTLTVESDPSLVFPVAGKTGKAIQSFWGAPRDGGGRSHEGVDIFARRGTPVVAAMDGYVSRVGVNRLGGNIIFLYGSGLSLYYAHLDSQLVSSGQKVKAGDTIGLVGNSGNAVHTSPHLHFGIYARGEGAIDPLAFIDDIRPLPAEPMLSEDQLGEYRSIRLAKVSSYSNTSKWPTGSIILERNSPFMVNALHHNYYRATLPDGKSVYIKGASTKAVAASGEISVTAGTALYINPRQSADVVTYIKNDTTLSVSGTFSGYVMTNYRDHYVWVKTPE